MRAAEVAQLEKVRLICEHALEDMATLPAKVRAMKPLLDDDFVAYLGYAVDKERAAQRKVGRDPDREPGAWLQVLGLVRQGVFAELAKDLRVSDDDDEKKTDTWDASQRWGSQH